MTTRPLNRLPASHHSAGARALVGPAATPIPSFTFAFPTPRGHGVEHELYEVRQAANRVYQARRAYFRKRAAELGEAEILEFVRYDVLKHILDTEIFEVGPFTLTRYRFMDPSKFRAWLPFQRNQAEALYGEFRRHLLKRLTLQDLGAY